jgi:hypothetical protein
MGVLMELVSYGKYIVYGYKVTYFDFMFDFQSIYHKTAPENPFAIPSPTEQT